MGKQLQAFGLLVLVLALGGQSVQVPQHKFLQTAHKYVEFGRAARLGLAGGPYKFTPVPLPPETN